MIATTAIAVVASLVPSAPVSAAISANLDQCANGSFSNPDEPACTDANDWVNGNLGASKAHFFEGESIPYRLRMGGLTTGTDEHNVIIEWDTTKQSKHALDYLTSYNNPPTEQANACAGVTPSPCASPPDPEPIPVDPQVEGRDVAKGARNFLLYGGTITTVSPIRYPDGEGLDGDKSAQLTVTFTAAVANPILAWGGHIASQAEWGAGNSAISIPGSPYHTRLIDLDGSGGNQDRSLATAAVAVPPAPAKITIIKDAVPNDAQDFNYTTTGGLSPSTFVLDDDSEGTRSNTQQFSVNVPASTTNTYTVTETAVPGWTPTVSCTDSVKSDSTKNGTTAVTIKLQSSETVECKFVNTRQPAKLIVKKHVVNNDGGTKVASNFLMSVTGANASPSSFAGSETGTTVTVDPGATYSVGETQLPGYARSDSGACTGSVNPGETKTCTITNDDIPLGLEVSKSASPSALDEPGGDVTFTVSVKNTSTLPVTLTSLTDNVYGNLNNKGTCATGGTIAAGATFTCSFMGPVTGNAGSSHTDTVTAVVTDSTGRTKTGQASATVTIRGTAPSIVVEKSGPDTMPEPGGTVTFTVVVRNTSVSSDPVTITSLTDDDFGELPFDDDCHVGTVLPPGGSCTLTFTGSVSGAAGETHRDVVTVKGHDDENAPVEDSDDHVITFICVPLPGNPAGATANGKSYAAKIVVPLLGINTTLPSDSITSSQTGVGNPPADEENLIKQNIAGIVALRLLGASSDAEITQDRATDASEANVATVDLLAGTVVAEAVTASTVANATGAGASAGSFDSTIAKLTVAGVGVVNVKPGLVVTVPGVGKLYVYDRQRSTSVNSTANRGDIAVDMLRLEVDLGPLAGTTIVISHAESHARFPSAKFCGTRPQGTVSGDAEIAQVLLDPPLATADLVMAGPIPASGGSDLASVALVGPIFVETTKVVGAAAATARTEGAFDGLKSASQSSAEVASLELLKDGSDPPLIFAQAVRSDASSLADGSGADSDASTTLVNLSIAGTNVCKELGLGNICEPEPNTEIVEDFVLIRLNEQTEETSGGSTAITVNAVHVFVLGEDNPLGLPVGAEIIISRSHSDACFDGAGAGGCSP